MAGIFDLNEPKHLLAKLDRELRRLRNEPDDVDHAFNFFTTAEHILDWLYPGYPGKSQREAARNGDPLLATVSHLATGAKHFDKLGAQHQSVAKTDHQKGIWAKGMWKPGTWAKGVWAEPELKITLTGDAASILGNTITALELAEKVYAYWSAPGNGIN